jgi:hypothetical protein
MPDLRRNLQTNQSFEGNEVNDGNGWPVPLCDPSNPLKMKVTNGQNGSQRDFKAMSTDGQDKLSLAEGTPPPAMQPDGQGSRKPAFQTSQMNPPNHSQPGGE